MNNWEKAAEILKQGGVVIIPTDSSYGIAALANNSLAVKRVYEIKGREANKPSLLIVGSLDQARKLAEFTPLAEDLARKYWPGGLTLILNAKKLDLPLKVYGTNSTPVTYAHLGGVTRRTLAIRLPGRKELTDLALGIGPFILPSANFSGETPPVSAQEVNSELIGKVDLFLDEPTDGNIVSTLLDARSEKPVILRNGSVRVEVKS